MRIVWALSAALVFGLAGCASNMPPALPDTGTLTVGVSGSGAGIGRVVLDLRIDGAVAGRIEADGGIFTRRDLAPGPHVVGLSRLPAGCRTDGPAERSITVSANQTTAVRFVVRCDGPA